jgi:class 3 adenylate cyclase
VTSLPTGTVTFLFADVEGSTRLMRELGEAWGSALTDYRRILRETFEPAGGREVDRQGDGLFFVFGRARAAVAAAAEAQRRLDAHKWPDGTAIRVRMGLHTGEPGLEEEGYLGLDVVRAARICAAGHGGQVLLSTTTQALAAGEPIEGVGTIDLGEHRLKDMERPERIHQLVVAGLQTRFAPLRTETQQPSDPLPLGGSSQQLARQVDAYVRDLRTQIEQEVVSGLREGLSPREREKLETSVRSGGLPAELRFALLAVGLVVLTILVIVWLTTS